MRTWKISGQWRLTRAIVEVVLSVAEDNTTNEQLVIEIRSERANRIWKEGSGISELIYNMQRNARRLCDLAQNGKKIVLASNAEDIKHLDDYVIQPEARIGPDDTVSSPTTLESNRRRLRKKE